MRIPNPGSILVRTAARIRSLFGQLLRAPQVPPRQADIEHALLRALGGI